MNMARFRLSRSLSFVSFLHAVSSIMVLFCFRPTDGISWLAVPDEHTNVQQGRPIILRWHYKIDDNETFLSSKIGYYEESKLYTSIASRHLGENTYYSYLAKYSILGKNDVTLIVQSTKIGNNITYCCEVVLRLVDKKEEDKRCFKVFVYAVPRITYYVPELSCKQSDSIKLQCNTTGFPSPRVWWTHVDNDTRQIGSSSDILLIITGKRSGGRYCCDADNGFGKADTACTVVNVTEYEPENTTILLVNQTNRDNINIIHVKCKADAAPPSNNFIIKIDDKQYNSSNGVIKVPAARKDKRDQIAVSCIPFNRYGQGPIKKIVFPVHAPPRFITPLPTLYNMTVSGITLKCETKGTPTPNITWISGDSGDIVSTGKYYNVSYVKCATKTITFLCHARNEWGKINSTEIRVNVMTKHNCSTADKGLDETTPTALRLEIIAAITCACLIFVVVIVVVAVRFWRRIKASKVKNMDENIYQDPIDAVDLEREGSLSLVRITSTNDDYATVEECGVPTSWSHVKTNVRPTGEKPLCERLVLPGI